MYRWLWPYSALAFSHTTSFCWLQEKAGPPKNDSGWWMPPGSRRCWSWGGRSWRGAVVLAGDDGDVGCLVNPMGIDQEKRQRILNLLMGGLKLMGKMKAMVSFPWNFLHFRQRLVRTWSFLPWSIQILVFSYTERVVVYLVLSHHVPYTKEWYNACIV